MEGSISTGDAPPWEPWKDVPADILGLVLRLIPCFVDRSRVRSVCRSWRAAAAIQSPPPPLPMLVFSRFSFASFSPTMMFTAICRILLPTDVRICWVGSFDEWLVGTQPSKECKGADGHCFLVNPFSREMIHLPQPPCSFHFCDYFKSVPIVNTSGWVYISFEEPGWANIMIHERRSLYEQEYLMSFRKVVLSASPMSGSMCIAAAISGRTLALWHTGMTSWCVCTSFDIHDSADIVFYQGRIYLVTKYSPKVLFILFFELEEVDGRVMVSYVEQCVTEPLPLVEGCQVQQCNIVEWRGKLLLIIRYADSDWEIRKIGIYSLDFSTNHHSFTEINSLDGDCLFISSCSSKSFPACQYDANKGDFVYFVSNYRARTSVNRSFDVLMYNVRDGIMKGFPVMVPRDNSEPFMDNLLWLFPPK